MSLKPIELVKAVVPKLTEKEKDEVRQMLGLVIVHPSGCAKTGHSYKVIAKSPGGWWSYPTVNLYCCKCGETVTRRY